VEITGIVAVPLASAEKRAADLSREHGGIDILTGLAASVAH
jgi:hypothetical protein